MLTQTPTGSVNLQASFATEAELQAYPYAGAYPAGWEVYVVATDKYMTYYPAGTAKGALAGQAGLVVVPTVGGGAFVLQTTGVMQAATAQISANTTVAVGAGITDLLTVTFTTLGGDLEVLATFSAQNDTAAGVTAFEIWLDGVLQGPGAASGASLTSAAGGQAQSGAIAKRLTGVAAAAHTVKLRWKAVTAASTSRIDPTALDEHASLTVKEVNR